MLGIIASPSLADSILVATKSEDILFERKGEFKTDEFLEFCKGASQISLRYLVVDMSCTTKEAIIRGVRFFRLRSNARIILLASGKKPGDPVISTLVNLGVWDILTPDIDMEDEGGSEVSEAISRQMKLSYNYGNASRWHYLNDDSIFREEKQAKDRRSGMKILAISGVIMAIMTIPIAYMLLRGKGTEQPVLQPIPAVAPAPQPSEQPGEMVLDLSPITTPVCPTCSTFEIEGGNTESVQQIHGKIQGGTFYMEPSAFQAFPGVIKSLNINPDSSSKVEMVIKASGQQGEEVVVYANGEQPSIRIDEEILPLEPAVSEEMRKGWVPIRAVLENAGYKLYYDEISHKVKLKSK